MKKKNKFVLLIMLLGLVLIVMGSAYAYFQFRKDSDDNIITMGDIYLEYTDGNAITYDRAFPMSYEEAITLTNNYKDFKVAGSNGTSSDINYGIYLANGAIKSEYSNFRPNELAFELVKIVDDEEEVILSDLRVTNLNDQLIYIGTVESGDTDYEVNYRLRAWVNDSVSISDTKSNATYTSSQYEKKYLSVRIKVQTITDDNVSKNLYNLVYAGSVLDNISSEFVTSSNGIDLTSVSSNTNGKGKYIFSSTQNDKYPIVYYRGDVNNNNLIFSNKCWSIVRTTETGGVKIIYNGSPSNNTCTNHGSAYVTNQFAGTGKLYYSGFMYNNDYDEITSVSSSYYKSDSYKYDITINGYYLDGNNKGTGNDASRYYTIENSNSEAKGEILYYNFNGSRWMKIKNGETPEEVFERVFEPKISASSKVVLESFFNNEIKNKNNVGFIEDTVYCNDRTYKREIDGSTPVLRFGSYYKLTGDVPVDLKCPNVRDSFTYSRSRGNGNLIRPIGLVTIEELMLTGAISLTSVNTSNTYIGIDTLTMSPIYCNESNTTYMTIVDNSGVSFTNNSGVRPVVSLAYGVRVTGTGTPTDPYIVS